jgi:GNAT superfamily N-acetyltransferase
MIQFIRTTSEDAEFRTLVALLDQDLALRNGDEHAFYAQYNKVDALKQVVVAYVDGAPVGCGAIKAFEPGVAEVKRMYTQPEQRGRGIAQQVLAELETWAAELGFNECILETGKKQPEAIRLYQKSGYQTIPNYGQYAGVENSVCMKKSIS